MIWLLFALFQGYMVTRCPSGLAPESLLAAQGWTHGLVPYRDFQMHVGPLPAGIFYLLFSIPPLAWCSLIFSLFTFLSAVGTYKLATGYVSRIWALGAAGLFLIGNVFLDGNAMEVQTLLTTFGVWAFYFYEEDRPWLMALMLFGAFLTKQTALLYLFALVPFWGRRDYLASGWVFLVGGTILGGAAYFVGALFPTIQQLSGWTLYHAILDPIDRWPLYKLLLLRFSPFAGVAVLARWPSHFIFVAVLFLLGFAVVPESHFLLSVLPFFCVMTVIAVYQSDGCLYALICLVSLVGVFGGGRLARQVGSTGRQYGLMDFYHYQAVIAKEKPIKEPVWTNAGMLYFLNDWSLPGNNFLLQTQIDLSKIPWDKEPYAGTETRIFLAQSTLGSPLDGGTWQDYKLDRGHYHYMRIWRKNETTAGN